MLGARSETCATRDEDVARSRASPISVTAAAPRRPSHVSPAHATAQRLIRAEFRSWRRARSDIGRPRASRSLPPATPRHTTTQPLIRANFGLPDERAPRRARRAAVLGAPRGSQLRRRLCRRGAAARVWLDAVRDRVALIRRSALVPESAPNIYWSHPKPHWAARQPMVAGVPSSQGPGRMHGHCGGS